MKKMNKQEVLKVLETIKRAQKILLSLHVNPDPDSIGSNLALKEALESMSKDVTLISADGVPKNLDFLPGVKAVQYENIAKMDIGQFDLFIALDSSEQKMINANPFEFPSSLAVVVIDHHRTNTKYGQINLVDSSVGSTGELLFSLFREWDVVFTKSIAVNLLAAICGDTGTFRFSTTSDTLKIASELMGYGATLSEINFALYQSTSLESLKLWGVILENLKIEPYLGGAFAWSVLPHAVFKRFDSQVETQGASNMFLQGVSGTNFGMLLSEEREGVVKGSLRGRSPKIDVSKIAALFGGGGHKGASGFRLEIETSFDHTVAKVVATVKDYVAGREM